MKQLLSIFLIITTIVSFATETKTENTGDKGFITGTIIDSSDGKPVEYATIALYSKTGNKLIDGGISDSEGYFKIKNTNPGDYYITITFMGYKTITVNDIKFDHKTHKIDLGNIKLAPNVKELNAVNVVADQAAVQYKIDKKVVNVSQQLAAKSGTAVDILENIPSVKVDIEGNVTLRGSGSFTVLIDGKPTVLDPSDALSQIPAGAIDNIEIITNPSAKYEPDGAAGIINIVTKKNKLKGTSGIVNVNGGRFNNYGGDFTIDTRKEKIHFYIGGDYNYRYRLGDLEYNRDVYYEDNNNYHVNSNGDFEFYSSRYSIKGGFDKNLSKNTTFGIGLRFGGRSGGRDMEKNYQEYFDNSPEKMLYITDDNSSRDGYFYEANLDFKHHFNKEKTHYLEAQVNYNGRNFDETTENIRRQLDYDIESSQKSTEDGPGSTLRLKLDYTVPTKFGKIEAGWQTRIENSDADNKIYNYDTLNNEYIFMDKYSYNTVYDRNIHSVYGLLAGEYGDFGYQAGLRMEYTNRQMELTNTGEKFKIDRPDFFPTLHLSYKMPAEQQIMVSYTRRIDRPRGYQLEPFVTIRDAYNVRQGNPDIKPEYINSLDLSYQKKFQKRNFFSVEGYYRITENKIERVMTPYSEDSSMFLHTYVNAGTDYSLGVEFMVSYSPAKWFTTNLMGDLYDYRLKGTLYDKPFEQHNFSWNARFNNTFKVGTSSRFQLDFMYQSQSVRAQGTSEGFFSASAAYKQDFFKRKMSATLQVRDLFGTWKHEFVSKGEDFYQYTYFKPHTPFVMLTLTYKINNYKAKRNNRSNGSMDSGDSEIL